MRKQAHINNILTVCRQLTADCHRLSKAGN